MRFACAVTAVVLSALAPWSVAAADAPERREVGDIIMENLPSSIRYDGRAVFDHMRTRNSYSVRGWTHDGEALLFSRQGNLYRSRGARSRFSKVLDFEIDIDGAQAVQVCGAPGYVFRSDVDGDEYADVFVATGSTFEPSKISVGSARNISVIPTNDRTRIAYASAGRGTGVWRLYLQDLCAGATPEVLYEGAAPFYPENFHPDDTHLLATRVDDEGFRLSEIDLSSGAEEILLSVEQPIKAAIYSDSGEYIFFTTNAFSEFVELYRMDRDTGDVIAVMADVGLDIDGVAVSDDRTRMAVEFNRAGLSSLLVIDMQELALIAGSLDTSLGVVSAVYFSPDGEELAVSLSQPTVPSRSGIFDYRTGEFEAWSGGFDRAQRITDLIPEITTYPTFDEVDGEARRIPTLVYIPETASPEDPAPVVIVPHGGPESQSKPSFNRRYHYYVTEMGLAVIRPNIRGSTGYGKSYEQLDEVERRGDAIRDIGALLDWIEERPDLDASRVVIAGGSYGGFVTLAALATYPDRFLGGISSAGVTDFETFLHNTEPYRLNNRRREYGDERDPATARFFDSISPLHNASNITAPILIIQGRNDPRVPEQQAEAIVDAVRANGVRVSYLLAKNEGHSFSNRDNRLMSSGARVAFLRELLLE